MAKHSFLRALEQTANAIAKAQRAAEANSRRREREQAKSQQQAARFELQHLQLSTAERASLSTADITAQVEVLQAILQAREHPTSEQIFNYLSATGPSPQLSIPEDLQIAAEAPQREWFTNKIQPETVMERILRRKRYETELIDAELAFTESMAQWQAAEDDRLASLADRKDQHQREIDAFEANNQKRRAEVQELRIGLSQRDQDATSEFFDVVLGHSTWPEDFPQFYRVAYEPAGKHLIVDYELPAVGVVPSISEHKYVKSKNAIEGKPRKPAEVRELYRELVASVTLRCIHECFSADDEKAGSLDVLTFNGFVRATDPATGADVRPYIISVRVVRELFESLDLNKVDPKTCLRNLGAQLSPQPSELIPVKPLVEFDMFDRRFVQEQDVLSGLDQRPNLMDLTPAEFEALVANLFSKMGLETKLTQTSRDGGVDAVAFDLRPVLGGKVVIQAKRYRHTVGVSAVRDLYGTMQHEGANKGILVTTSSYGPDAYAFQKDKPIELINGSALLYHLEQVGVRARIIFPQEN